MKRAKTTSYIVELLLLTTREDELFLNHCRYLGLKADECMVKEANRRINKYFRDPEVKAIRKKHRKKGHKLSKDDKAVLDAKRKEYGLSEYAFQDYLKVYGRQLSNYLDASTVQKIATQVWRGAHSVLFGKGKAVRFKDYDHFLSLEGKSNTTGIRYKDGYLIWGKNLKIPVRVPANDKWLHRAMQDRVKYCRIVARWHHTHWRYHLQLILEGVPPAKPKRKVVDAVAGIDIGPSTVAAASQCGVLLQELGAEVNSIEAEIARLDRKMDRQRRASNPDNYDPSGRIKRLKKGERRVWHYSNGYYKTRAKRRTLYAKRKALLKQSHTMLANYMLENLGNYFFVEKMSMAGLSKRSKKNKINKKTGRPRSKRRFGKSIQNHAPSQFIEILARKAKASGGDLIKVDPTPLKASQYDHTNDTCKKASLNQRTKVLSNGDEVQRDLYSAFLLSCLEALDAICRSKCIANYSKFKRMHDILIHELRRQKAAGAEFPQCMGI